MKPALKARDKTARQAMFKVSLEYYWLFMDFAPFLLWVVKHFLAVRRSRSKYKKAPFNLQNTGDWKMHVLLADFVTYNMKNMSWLK